MAHATLTSVTFTQACVFALALSCWPDFCPVIGPHWDRVLGCLCFDCFKCQTRDALSPVCQIDEDTLQTHTNSRHTHTHIKPNWLISFLETNEKDLMSRALFIIKCSHSKGHAMSWKGGTISVRVLKVNLHVFFSSHISNIEDYAVPRHTKEPTYWCIFIFDK